MDRQAVIGAIEDGVAGLGQTLPAGAADKLAALLGELARWNERVNLTAIRDLRAMVPGHVLDSLAVRPLVVPGRVADVGTGAGFPGLPLALAEPGLDVELLDSNAKKIAFVRHIIGELGIGNARAVRTRAEHYAKAAGFDTVTVRALGTLPRLLEVAGRLVGDRGVLLALKGQYPHDELEQLARMTRPAAKWDHEVTAVTVPGLEMHARHVVSLTRRRRAGAA